jgi:hypothetical protein
MSKETITITMLQEVMFDLYDIANGNQIVTGDVKELAKELADKLAEVEKRLEKKDGGYQ